jgi:hypothetical protein
VDGELKLALVEIIDEILAQDTACTKMNQGEKLVTSDSRVSTDETGWDAHDMTHRNITDDIFQFDKNNLDTSMPTIDMYGQLLWPTAKRKPSGSITSTDEYLDSAEVRRNEQLNVPTETHYSGFATENFETTPDRSTNPSQQFTYTTVTPKQKPLDVDQTNSNKLDDKIVLPGNNISDSNSKTSLRPDQERKLILILTKMFDAEFRKGNYPFNQVARNVLQLLGEKFGSNVANQISIEHLQGAYIGMSARYKNQGATQTHDVIAVRNKSELEDTPVINENGNSHLKNVTQDAKVVYLMGEGSVQYRQLGSNEIGKRGIRSNNSVPEKNDLQINTGAPNISSGATSSNVHPLSGSTDISEIPLESGSATIAEAHAVSKFTANTVLRNTPETDSVAQHQELAPAKELLSALIEEKHAEGFHLEKYIADALNVGSKTDRHLDTIDNHGTKFIDATMAMEGSFTTADDVHKTLGQPITTPELPIENTTQAEPNSTLVTQNQTFNQLLSTNTLIPLDKACAARTRIKSQLESHVAKPNPDLLIDGATLAVAFIEAGVREYGEYTHLMIDDIGCKIEPYLRDFYEGACYYLGLDCPKEHPTHQVRGGGR